VWSFDLMMLLSRRDFGRFGGGALIVGLAARGGPIWAREPARGIDPLRFVAPELRAAAMPFYQPNQESQWSDEGLAKMRASRATPETPWLTDVPVEQLKVPVGKGHPDVTIYIINAKAGTRRPGILHTHGGGYILGSARSEVTYEQGIAKELDCVVVTVEYRLAPETTYIGSVEDIYAGLTWMHQNSARIGLDPTRLAVMGESAGGGLAARLAITARDRGQVPLCAQILVYPMLDDRTGSTIQLPPWIGAVLWTPAANRFGWKSFLGMSPGGSDVPAAAVPARVSDLSRLPPAFIGVGSVDLFMREDIEYGRRLIEAGVPVALDVVPGAFHAFDRIAPDTDLARRFTREKMNALRKAFGQETL